MGEEIFLFNSFLLYSHIDLILGAESLTQAPYFNHLGIGFHELRKYASTFIYVYIRFFKIYSFSLYGHIDSTQLSESLTQGLRISQFRKKAS